MAESNPTPTDAKKKKAEFKVSEKQKKIEGLRKDLPFMNRPMTRRAAISTGAKIGAVGVAALAVGAAGGYLARGSSPTSTVTSVSTATTTVTAPGTPTSTSSTTCTTTSSSLAPLSGPSTSLVFAIGAFDPSQVQSNINEFDAEFNSSGPKTTLEQFSCCLIAQVEAHFAAGEPIDLTYSYSYTIPSWAAANWILPLNDIVQTDVVPYSYSQITADLVPWWEGAYSVNGQLYGLPYYVSALGPLLTNEKLIATQSAVASADIQTWADYYSAAETLQGSSGNPVVLSSWYNETFGIPWGFVGEVISQGQNDDLFADEAPYAPTFSSTTGLAYEVLNNWLDAWNSNLVPHSVITMKQSDYLTAFGTGNYYFQSNSLYYEPYFNNASNSTFAGQCSIVPANNTQPNWGVPDNASYSLGNRSGLSDTDQQYAQALMEFMGYQNRYGQYYVEDNWITTNGLPSGYTNVLSNPSISSALSSELYSPNDLTSWNSYISALVYPSAWKSTWYNSWNTRAQTDLPQIFTGQMSISDALTDLYNYGQQLASASTSSTTSSSS